MPRNFPPGKVYTLPMNLNLDAESAQRIERELARGHYREPAEVVARALTLLEAQEEWFQRNKDAINDRLEESAAQVKRGKFHTPEEAARILDAQIARAAQRAG